MIRPHLSFDRDGTPRVTLPSDENGNGGNVSVRVSPEGLAEFIGEVKDAVMSRSGDPELQRKIGKSLLDVLGKWARS